MKRLITITILVYILSLNSFSQVYEKPIAGKISHPELEIIKIEITENETVISLKVTNKLSEGGWFCADKNIEIRNSKGTEIYKLIKSEDIPTCPDQFKFAYSGQVLEFKLYFPPISNEIKFIDLIENCSNACFYFYGIILDNEHNKKIRSFETGFEHFQNEEFIEAILYFEKVLSGTQTIDSHIYGLSYYYLVLSNKSLGNNEKAMEWYNKLLESDIKEKQTFIKELEKENL